MKIKLLASISVNENVCHSKIYTLSVMGRNANSLTEWKLKSGKTFKEYESSEIVSEA